MRDARKSSAGRPTRASKPMPITSKQLLTRRFCFRVSVRSRDLSPVCPARCGERSQTRARELCDASSGRSVEWHLDLEKTIRMEKLGSYPPYPESRKKTDLSAIRRSVRRSLHHEPNVRRWRPPELAEPRAELLSACRDRRAQDRGAGWTKCFVPPFSSPVFPGSCRTHNFVIDSPITWPINERIFSLPKYRKSGWLAILSNWS
jgi:hypothetical protein